MNLCQPEAPAHIVRFELVMSNIDFWRSFACLLSLSVSVLSLLLVYN